MKKHLNKVVYLGKKHSPELLVGVGITAIIGGTVMIVKANGRASEIMDEHEKAMSDITDVQEMVENGEDIDYTEEDAKKDKVLAYVQTGIKFIKLYSPGITLVGAGIASVLGAHGIMKKRNVALMAAYNGVEKAYSDYRAKVVEAYGEDKDYDMANNIITEKVKVKVEGEDGKMKTVTQEKRVVGDGGLSPYSRVFDNLNRNWNRDQQTSLYFLKAQQNYANDLLKSRGYLFLNEVYNSLGFEATKEGQLVGWFLDGEGDDYVDFGIFNMDTLRPNSLVDGAGEHAVILDFNVDGVVYDKI